MACKPDVKLIVYPEKISVSQNLSFAENTKGGELKGQNSGYV